MPKGYVISRVDITNPEAYARYAAAATKAIADHGGKPLARGGRHEALEGKARARNVVLEFDSYEAARALLPFRAISGGARAARGRGRDRDGSGRGSLTMPKGYWIAHVDVTRSRDLQAISSRPTRVAFAKYGARFLVRGGKHVVAAGKRAGAPRGHRVSATTQPRSPATIRRNTSEAAKLRDAGAAVDLVIAEGYDGPQPG